MYRALCKVAISNRRFDGKGHWRTIQFDSKGVSGAKNISVAVEAAGYRGVKLSSKAGCGDAHESMIASKAVPRIFAPSAYFACSAY